MHNSIVFLEKLEVINQVSHLVKQWVVFPDDPVTFAFVAHPVQSIPRPQLFTPKILAMFYDNIILN